MKRERFQSRLGFLLVSAGCAVGIGNVWKFPYVTGENGGGVFVLFYLLFLVIMGVPVLTMELAVGRASRKSAVLGYKALEPAGSKWHLHGWFCVAGCCLLMMYYTTVSGWMLGYFFKFAGGVFDGLEGAAVNGVFDAMRASPVEMIVWMAITVLGGFLVCSFKLQSGLERITKWMMLGLLGLIAVLAVHSLTLPGGLEGVKFYLLPDFGRAMDAGIGGVITAAMNQAFFTLSLGIAAMEVFGSYMKRDHTLTSEAVRICSLDTFVALMAGLIIFPACFSLALFFLFMTFASFSTVIAVFENLQANAIDNFGWNRKKAAVINCVFILLASLPCVLGNNLWSGVRILGRDVLDFEDFLVSNLLLPIGSLVYLLFCVTKWGWGWDKYLAEANAGEGIKMPRWLKPVFQFVLPILVLVILIQGLLP